VLKNYNNPSKIKDMVTDEGYKRMKEVLNKTLMKQVDQYVENGTITKSEARDMLAEMLEGEGSYFDPSEWERVGLGELGKGEQDSYQVMFNTRYVAYNTYTNGEKKISKEEYEKKVLANKLQNPLSQVDYDVFMENEIRIIKYNQDLYNKTKFNFTDLKQLGANIQFLGNSFNSSEFTSPAYPISSARAYEGLRENGELSLGVSILVHKDDLENFKGSIVGANGEIKFDLSDEDDREKLNVYSMEKGRGNVAATNVWKNTDLEKGNRENYFIIPGAIMDHNPFPSASVDKDGYIASENSNKNAHKRLK
jgi:hypothetical protein